MKPPFAVLSRSSVTSGKNSFRVVAALCAVIVGLGSAALTARAQVSTVDSALITPRIINDLTNADLTVVSNYPALISFTETNAGTTNTAFSPNQDMWQFSADGGVTAYNFQSNDYFSATMSVTLTGSPISPRKETGFAFSDVGGNINGQYILDTDGHECVAFGGNLPFYAFPHFFNSGDTVRMGVTLLKDPVTGNDAIIYSADGTNSPILDFAAGDSPATTGNTYTLGGYFQIQGQGTGVTNSGSAAFANITIVPQPTLGIASAGNQVVLYWPAGASNYVLQSSTNVDSTNWVTVTNGAPIIGVTLTNTTPATFFRLQAQ